MALLYCLCQLINFFIQLIITILWHGLFGLVMQMCKFSILLFLVFLLGQFIFMMYEESSISTNILEAMSTIKRLSSRVIDGNTISRLSNALADVPYMIPRDAHGDIQGD
ncbi:uncharacterized protein LOC142219529 [Haematobia irritans]|uniref:uncharacterized protein LOC142219529 n=1 Tax=Haematobia irritans TaxID=7368 RepID=UPI003F4FE7D8